MFATDNTAAVTAIDFLGQQTVRPAWHEKPPVFRNPFDVSAFLQPSYEAEGLGSDLVAIEQLPENWDGYGAVRILPEVAANTRAFLRVLTPRLPSPDMTPNPNGTISLEWESKHGLAHLEIGADTASLFVRPVIGGALYFDGAASGLDPNIAGEIAALLYPVNRGHAISEATLVFGEIA